MSELIAERTGSKAGTIGGIFKLNPRVDDLPDDFSVKVNGVKHLVLGTVEKGGSGCICPESTMLKALMKHVIVRRDEVVIMDMEAGIEHLGRGTAASVDAMLVVVEPGQRSVQTARQIQKLAADLKLLRVFLVLNKVHDRTEEEQLRSYLPDLPVIGMVQRARVDPQGRPGRPLAVRRRPRVRRRDRGDQGAARKGNRGVSRRARQLTEGKMTHADYR